MLVCDENLVLTSKTNVGMGYKLEDGDQAQHNKISSRRKSNGVSTHA